MAEEKLGSHIKVETRHEILEINRLTFVKTGLELVNRNLDMAVKQLEVADPVSGECWASDRPMKPDAASVFQKEP
jgi:hypothetical protein